MRFSSGFNHAAHDGAARRVSARPTWRWLGIATLGVCVLPLLVASKEYSTSTSMAKSVLLAPTHSDPVAVPAVATPPPAPMRTRADFGRERPSRDAYQIANWVVHSSDNRAMPFLIVDKRKAKVYAFDASGALRGAAPVLLGLGRGDESVPGIGERKMSEIRPHERTTPAGRFVAELGRNTKGEDIVWIDYDSAVSMHRVRALDPKERRLSRLSSPTPADNRISYGCINVPVAFYETVLLPTMARRRAVVYVLPDIRSAREVFGAYDVDERLGVSAKQMARPVAHASAKTRRPAPQ
jgi:hypothetical protein